MRYPRNMQGYGGRPPAADWPGGAHVAVSLVLNYEEGGENCILHGDAASEGFLSEIPGAQPWPGQRHWNMESVYEYGARAGFWRLRDLFVSRAASRSPSTASPPRSPAPPPRSPRCRTPAGRSPPTACAGSTTATTPPRPSAPTSRRPSASTPRSPARPRAAGTPAAPRSRPSTSSPRPAPSTGSPTPTTTTSPTGASTPAASSSSSPTASRPTTCASRPAPSPPPRTSSPTSATPSTPSTPRARPARPKMMSVGLHCRLVGRPGRIKGLAHFLDHVRARGQRLDRHPRRHRRPLARPPPGARRRRAPDHASRSDAFVARFGGIFEHSPWIAERAYALELGPAHDTAVGPRQRARPRLPLRQPEDERLGVLKAHPDLAGKLAAAKRLTAEIDRRAGRRRPRRPDRRRARPLHRAERRLPGQVRLPLHHRRARPRQGAHPRRLRDPRRQRPRQPSSPPPAPRSSGSRSSD